MKLYNLDITNFDETNLKLVNLIYDKDYPKKQYNDSLELCLLTSLYNLDKTLFKNDYQNIYKIAKKINYENLVEVNNYLNQKFYQVYNRDILKYTYKSTKFLQQIEDIILTNIDNNKPVVLIGINDLKNNLDTHAITVYGYDKDWYYIFENGNNSIFVNQLIVNICVSILKNETQINDSSLKKCNSYQDFLDLFDYVETTFNVYEVTDKFTQINRKYLKYFKAIIIDELLIDINSNLDLINKTIQYSLNNLITRLETLRVTDNFSLYDCYLNFQNNIKLPNGHLIEQLKYTAYELFKKEL